MAKTYLPRPSTTHESQRSAVPSDIPAGKISKEAVSRRLVAQALNVTAGLPRRVEAASYYWIESLPRCQRASSDPPKGWLAFKDQSMFSEAVRRHPVL